MGVFDKISPEILAKLVKVHSFLCGELFEMAFDDLRLISRPFEVMTGGDGRAVRMPTRDFGVVYSWRLL